MLKNTYDLAENATANGFGQTIYTYGNMASLGVARKLTLWQMNINVYENRLKVLRK